MLSSSVNIYPRLADAVVACEKQSGVDVTTQRVMTTSQLHQISGE